jgi:DNA repair exonuclease SbcCD ATPase subunit
MSKHPQPQTPPKPEQMMYSPQTYLAEIEEENKQLQAELARMDNHIAVTYDYDLPKQVRYSPHSTVFSPSKASLSTSQDYGAYSRARWEPDQRKFDSQDSLPVHDCSRVSVPVKGKAEKTKVLEVRLKGALEAIKNLERLLKEKDEKLKRCEEELAKKSKLLEAAQATQSSVLTYQKSAVVQSSLTSIIRKKEKALEKHLKEKEAEVTQQKKMMSRLQQLNNTLLTKIKESESRASEVDSVEAQANKHFQHLKALKQTCTSQEEQIQGLMTRLNEAQDKLGESLRRYEGLLATSMEFEERTRDLYKANQILHENLLKMLDVA